MLFQRCWRIARLPLLIYVITLCVYLAASGSRLRRPTKDNHYVYLAKNLLDGRLGLDGNPPHYNDYARVEEITLRSGRRVRGVFLKTSGPHRFKTTKGEYLTIGPSDIATRKSRYYVSFPWFPAILMLPFVAIFGMNFNDVLFGVLVAPLNAVLVFIFLRRLATFGYSRRGLRDDLWLTALFAFGTVHFFVSVIGQVWYTAQIIGVGLSALYAIFALEARHPFASGLCLGLGFVTRTPIPFSFPFFVGEALRRHMAPGETDNERPPDAPNSLWHRIRTLWPHVSIAATLPTLMTALAPALTIAGLAFAANYTRFDSPFAFGHKYLHVRWTERIQRWGLFNYHFLSRNLAAMFTLLPRIMTRPPFTKISNHGLSIFFTTPIFSYLIWPKRRTPMQAWLYLSCLFPMILHLLYQHTGWVQFGYRFSLDYTVYLIALLALGGYQLGLKAKTLIVIGVIVNTFGAITFARYGGFYWDGMFPVL